jgi:hypothetical protein
LRVTNAKAGERLPYLLAKLKARRVLERLQTTAERARAEQWPYEQFLESLLEAEVFARDASGARTRIRHASFPALKTLEDIDWSAQPSAERPLVLHLAQLTWIEDGCAARSSHLHARFGASAGRWRRGEAELRRVLARLEPRSGDRREAVADADRSAYNQQEHRPAPHAYCRAVSARTRFGGLVAAC